MKKVLSALVFVLMTLAVLASNVLAAPAKSNRGVTLNSVSYERGGIVLLFHTSGLSKNDLKNISFTAHSEQWNMACNFVDDTTNVRCLVSKKLARFAGASFHGALAGIYFGGTLPSIRAFPNLVVAENSMGTVGCSDGQTLWYTFEYSNTSYQAEIWSDNYLDSNTFYSLYGVYPEYSSTYIENTDIYYIYGYTTHTSGHGAGAADDWDALISAYETDGYTVQTTGEYCN